MDLSWDVEFSDEFGEWWDGLTAAEQKSVDFTVSLLQELGPTLKDALFFRRGNVAARAYARTAHSARRSAVSRAVRIDPRRAAMLLVGGDKTGNNRWYEEYVPVADAVYNRHLRELERGE